MIATIDVIYRSQLEYYEKELLNYYVESDQEGMSRFYGKLARTYGIDGDAIAPGDNRFPSLFEGFHPFTQKPLVRNAGDPERVAGYDITFSAPKDLSIVMGLAFATGDFETVRKVWLCQNRAVRAALEQVQKDLITRVGQRTKYLTKAEGLFAIMNHTTSRRAKGSTYPDPQTHSHAILFNVCQRKDGTTGTIDGRFILNGKNPYSHLVGRIYRTVLSQEITREFGFVCRAVKLEEGESFEIEGISPAMKRVFSQRRQVIERKIALTIKGKPTAQDYQKASLSTRMAKKTFHRDELHAEWLKISRTHGFDLQGFLREIKNRVDQSQGEKPLNEDKPDSLLKLHRAHKHRERNAQLIRERSSVETFVPSVSQVLLTRLREQLESRTQQTPEKRKKQRELASKRFQRRILYLYTTGKMKRKTYLRYAKGKGMPKTALGIDLAYFTYRINQAQRIHLYMKYGHGQPWGVPKGKMQVYLAFTLGQISAGQALYLLKHQERVKGPLKPHLVTSAIRKRFKPSRSQLRSHTAQQARRQLNRKVRSIQRSRRQHSLPHTRTRSVAR